MYYGNVTYLNPLELAQPGTTDSFFFFFFPERIHTAFLPYHSQLGWLAKGKTGAHKQLRIWVQKPWCPDLFVHQCTDLHKALVALPSAASELNVSQTQHKHSSQNKITFSSQAWVIRWSHRKLLRATVFAVWSTMLLMSSLNFSVPNSWPGVSVGLCLFAFWLDCFLSFAL